MSSVAPISAPQNPLRRVLSGFATLAGAELVNKALAFLVVGYLGRSLTPEGYGLVTFATSLAGYFVLAVDMGLDWVASRAVARDPQSAGVFVRQTIAIRLVLALLTTVVYVLVAFQTPYPFADQVTVALYGLLFLPYALTPKGVLIGLERRPPWAIAQIAGQLTFTISCLLLISDRADTWLVPVAQGVADSIMAMVVLVVVWPLLKTGTSAVSWRQTLRAAVPFAGAQGMRILGYTFDVLLIGATLGATQVGYYGGAYKIVLLFLAFGALYTLNLLPAIARNFPDRLDAVRRLASQSLALAGIAMLPIAVGGSMLAEEAITLYFTESYLPAAEPLRILMITVAITVMGGAFRNVLIGADKQPTDLKIVSVAGLLNVVLNVLFTPTLGLVAAAWITVTSETFIFVASWWSARRVVGHIETVKPLVSPVMASIAMAAVLFVSPLPWPVSFFLSLVSYVAILYVTGGVKYLLRGFNA